MIEFVKKRRLKKMLIMIILIASILVIDILARSSHRILFFETWTPISSIFILGIIMFLLICIYVMIKWEDLFFRIAVVIGFIVITGFMSIMSFFSATPYETYHQDGYTIYVSQWRFIFSGSDTFYLKENVLTSVYIGSGDQSEEWYTTYYIQDDIFYIVETSETGTVETTTIVLND